MVFCLLVFASPGPFTELGSADEKPLSATSAPAAGCVIHTLVYYITFSPCAQLFCPVSAEKLTCFRRIPFSSPMLFYRLIVFNGRGVSQRLAHGTLSTFMGGGSFALPLLRTEPALRAAPVFRSAYFPKKLFSFFSKTLDLQVRFALPTMPHRNAPSRHSGVTVGLFSEKALQLFLQNARPSGSLRSPSDGRGKLRSPLHPSLPPPKNANGRAGGKRTRPGGKRNRARRRRRCYAAAQRTLARRSRARGLPVRGSQGQDGRPPRGSGGAAAPPVCPAAGAAGQRLTGGR